MGQYAFRRDAAKSLKVGNMCGCWISPKGKIWTVSLGHHTVAAYEIIEEEGFDRPIAVSSNNADFLRDFGYSKISLWSEFGIDPPPIDWSKPAIETGSKFLTDNDCRIPEEWKAG